MMAVVRIEGGVVTQLWRDVETVDDAVAKYGLDPADLVEADQPPGMLWRDGEFVAPAPRPRPAPRESRERRAIRALAARLSPEARAEIEGILE